VPPPKEQPQDQVTVGDITVKVTTIVLREVPANQLLADSATACFAAGADAAERSDDELCREVTAALAARGASWPERHMAVVAAATRGRYESMIMAMEQANLEPVVIEDLVKFGEDRGDARGQLKKARSALRRVLAARKIVLDARGEARIDACTDVETLDRWLDQAALATSAVEVLR
jgi:hypothetical protein